MIARIFACLMMMSCAVMAQDIVVLGEVHDNPAHHQVQAAEVATLKPAALVFEMLTPDQADGAVLDVAAGAEALNATLAWADSGWPDFAMYYPIFAAAAEARVYGAGVPRDVAMQAMQTGIADLFGDDAAAYGLAKPLPEAEQTARNALQMAAHCDALPAEMLPAMVEIQRLRDATLARTALRALQETGGPVAVITGNGHARPDWGVPAYLARVAPDVTVRAVGQTESGAPLEGGFAEVVSADAPDRADPCEAFR
ncbi:MAG: ChaN family lipoprotein [Roseovarius sp.]